MKLYIIKKKGKSGKKAYEHSETLLDDDSYGYVLHKTKKSARKEMESYYSYALGKLEIQTVEVE